MQNTFGKVLFWLIFVYKSYAYSQCNLLISNGNFSAGNTGFTVPNHTYVNLPISGCVNDGSYSVSQNADCFFYAPANQNAWQLASDHTGGGNLLIVNMRNTNTPNAFPRIYCTSATTIVGQEYVFEYWGKIPNVFSNELNPTIDLEVNGLAQNMPYEFQKNAPWTLRQYTFTATSTTTNLCLYQYTAHPGPASGGHDIAIDDVCLRPKVDSANVIVTTLNPQCPGDPVVFLFRFYNANGSLSAYTGNLCFTINDGNTNNVYQRSNGSTVVLNPNVTTTYSIYVNYCGSNRLIGQTTVTVDNTTLDPTFTSSDICVGGTNTISNIASPGLGTFSLLPASIGSGTVNPLTGIISGANIGEVYYLRHFVSSAGVCSGAAMVDTVYVSNADASFVMDDYCEGSLNMATPTILGGTYYFMNSPNNGATINQNTGVISNGVGGTTYEVVYQLSGGVCLDTTIEQVTVYERPTATISGSGDICDTTADYLNVIFTGIAPFDFTYSIGSNVLTLLDESALNVQIPISTTEIIVPIQISDARCVGTVSGAPLFIAERIVFTVDSAGTCKGEPRTFDLLTNALDTSSVCLWDFGDGTTANGCQSQIHTYTDINCYDVTLSISGNSGCVSSTKIQDITCVYGPPTAAMNWDPTIPTMINNRLSLFNASEGESSVAWLINNSVFSVEDISEIILPTSLDSTSQVCIVATSLDNCVDTFCQNFVVMEDPIIYIPNTFTPNGDYKNEQFYPVVKNLVRYEFKIFDRWGKQLFYSTNPDEKWDATSNGVGAVQSGMYVWELNYEDINGTNEVLHGRVFVVF